YDDYILTTNSLSNSDMAVVTFTGSFSISTSENRIYFEFTTNDGTTLNVEQDLGITGYTSGGTTYPGGGAVDTSLVDVKTTVVGVDRAFTSIATTTLVFDADIEDFNVASFNLTPSTSEGYYVDQITVVNSAATFDSDGDGSGVTDVRLYKDDGDSIFETTDTLIAQTSDNTVTFNSTTTAIINLDDSNETDAITNLLITTATTNTFFLAYNLGSSTNVLSDPSNSSSDPMKINAQVTNVTGYGFDSDYAYGPISISSATNNNFQGTVAGLVFYDFQSIFPSMNAAPGLEDIPIFKFTAKSVGITSKVVTLNISNIANTFDANGNQSGVSGLKWIKDDSGGDYSGYGTDAGSVNLDTNITSTFSITESSKAFITCGSNCVEISTGNTQIFYVLADFGDNMSSGSVVSLNISEDTRATSNGKTNLKIGSTFPLSDSATKSVTLVDPILTVKTAFTDQLFVSSNSTVRKIVAGMYDIAVYNFEIDVDNQISNATFQFLSPNGFFSGENTGVSKLSLYLDKDSNNMLSDGDVFLSSVGTFTESGRLASIPNVSLSQGKGQKLLLLMDIGQRTTSTNDQLSISLNNITVTGSVVASMYPNPISPYTYDVEPHLLQITNINTDISDTNIITQSSTFDFKLDVQAKLSGVQVQLLGSSSVPLTIPKFYLGGVSGKDRSYEFSSTFNATSSTSPGTILSAFNNPSSKSIVYGVSAANITSEGNYLVDADVYYTPTNNVNYLINNTLLTRSKGTGVDFKSAADLNSSSTQTKVQPSMTTTNDVYSWSLPSYVSNVEVQVNNQFTTFNSYQSIAQGAKLKITFINQGKDIDPSSISLSLNGTDIPAESAISSGSTANYYKYESTTGVLTINSLGTQSGQLTLSVNDMFGEAYPSAPFIFYTSEDLQIQQLLVYPNPFSPTITSSGITIGFSLTQQASVSFKVYDAMGREVSRLNPTSFPMGYNTQTWDSIIEASGNYISSGTYFIKMTAKGEDGTEVRATTKWAVY
ncbi:MAG: T9SS type A sorting domain-containing protein, partial [Candidatus Margulisiibacteriota bacterium]